MNGGSFNYLYSALWTDGVSALANRGQDIKNMANALRAEGYDDIATNTEEVFNSIVEFENKMYTLIGDGNGGGIGSVWKAIEWYYSGDWGQDSVARAAEKYRNQANNE